MRDFLCYPFQILAMNLKCIIKCIRLIGCCLVDALFYLLEGNQSQNLLKISKL